MAHLSHERVQQLYQEFGELKVLDDIIRHRAADHPPLPILGYPRFKHSVVDYELFTGKQLDLFVDATVKYFIRSGLEPNGRKTIALLAPSNLTFIVSFFALSRLGYTILSLSLRITPAAILNLLQRTNCTTIVYDQLPPVQAALQEINQKLPMVAVRIPLRSDYDVMQHTLPYFIREYDREEENSRIALIIHSSGSTGLPKPIFLSHRALLCHPTQGSGLHNFNALPWYHLYGISTSLQAMWMRKTAYLYNVSLPLTADNLVAVVEKIRPEAVQVVPYVLGLIAEKEAGVQALKSCKLVTAAGARTPDELGDRLVKEGVNLGVVFGTTEAGLAGDTMRRAPGDDSWDYIRIYANIRQHMYMNPLGDGLFEFVYLKGHPALSTLELSDDPTPGSWHSKDVFTPHPTILDAWKYVTRLDDRVTLINGEKVLPLPIEGRLREDPLVREAAVVGIDRSIPGMLVFRAPGTDGLSEEAYLDAIWPSVAEANSRAEAFSQITRDMIKVLPSEITYPQTDKGSIIRAQIYKVFASKIEDLYTKSDIHSEGGLTLGLPAIEEWIMTSFRETIGITLPSTEADFFSSGVDSLKAIQMRRLIQKTLDLQGATLSPNVVYEKANPRELARYLFALRHGNDIPQEEDDSTLAQQLIQKYSVFEPHTYLNGLDYGVNGDVVKRWGNAAFLTGTTGSIGAHTLAQLLPNPTITKIYCPVRGSNPLQRVFTALTTRHLSVSENDQAKIFAFESDLARPDFSLSPAALALLKRECALIIHIAWPVNFNLPLKTFEPSLQSLQNLLTLSTSVKRPAPARFFFASSISVALNAPAGALVPETFLTDFTHVAPTGYARSKFVGEHVVARAVETASALASVLRIGQVVGDTAVGIWNEVEFLPMMIRSALVLGALPWLSDDCSWLPVNTLASTILDLITITNPHTPKPAAAPLYNLLNPHTFTWPALLTSLRASGLRFHPVPFPDWLSLLQKSAANKADDRNNPAVKLLPYFETNYHRAEKLGGGGAGIRFATGLAERDSLALREAPRCVEAGLVGKFVGRWMERWGGGGGKGGRG
ncbi:MAG: hypothetical protein LQ339_006446 [Xanthoria mediterranea]|nr:MAG: hypothetical protein LQ339_006446 [Xanthoria mediterranea]